MLTIERYSTLKWYILKLLSASIIIYAITLTLVINTSFNLNDFEIVRQGRRFLAQENLHKDLFPLNESDKWGFFFVGIGTMIAASGGIGGGGILVPLLILVFDFHPKYAIPLSNFTILGSSITNMALNLYKRHPDADRPLVDWDLIMIMEPLTMGGAVVGAILSKILPDWILTISLVILLAYTTKTTLDKGISQFNKETQSFEQDKKSVLIKVIQEEDNEKNSASGSLLRDDEDEDDEDDETNNLASKNKSTSEIPDELNVELSPLKTPTIEINPELKALLDEEKITPMNRVQLISLMVVVVMILNLVKGGSHFPSALGIRCGSYSYWFVTILVFAWVIGISIYCRQELITKWKLKRRLNYRYAPGDVEWNEKNTLIYPSLCFFAGFFAGLFGVGGGIVKGPLMLEMGVNPLVASGTVAVMIMFTSVAATTMFIAFGTLTWDYAIALAVVGLVTTIVGQFGVSYLVEKYKRVSLVSLSIGAVVALSTVLMAIQSIFSLIDAEEGHQTSSSVC